MCVCIGGWSPILMSGRKLFYNKRLISKSCFHKLTLLARGVKVIIKSRGSPLPSLLYKQGIMKAPAWKGGDPLNV